MCEKETLFRTDNSAVNKKALFAFFSQQEAGLKEANLAVQ